MQKFSRRQVMATALTSSLVLGLVACSPAAQNDGTQIVVTSGVLGDFAQELLEESHEITVLIPAGSDPHEYQPSTADINHLHHADAVFAVGLGFEESLEPQLDAAASDGVHITYLAEAAQPLSQEELYADGGSVRDPHVWQDPQRAHLMLEEMAAQLTQLDGVDSEQLRTRAEAYLGQLDDLDEALQLQFASLTGVERQIVTQHRSLGYLTERYELDFAGQILPGVSTAAEANAQDLQRTAALLKERDIRVIFTDMTHAHALADTLVDELEGDLELVPLYTESLSEAGGEADSYLSMMEWNAAQMVESLKRD